MNTDVLIPSTVGSDDPGSLSYTSSQGCGVWVLTIEFVWKAVDYDYHCMLVPTTPGFYPMHYCQLCVCGIT